MINSQVSNQFLMFLITGGIAALVNFGSRIIYNIVVDFSYAIIFAYLTGMVTAFILARRYVFTQSSQKIHKSVMFFSLVNLAAVAQTWVISMGLAYYLLPYFGIVDYVLEISHAVGISIPVFTSYLGHKNFTFK